MRVRERERERHTAKVRSDDFVLAVSSILDVLPNKMKESLNTGQEDSVAVKQEMLDFQWESFQFALTETFQRETDLVVILR